MFYISDSRIKIENLIIDQMFFSDSEKNLNKLSSYEPLFQV